MKMRTILVGVMVAGTIASFSFGQNTQEQGARPAQLLANLRSNDPGKRSAALQEVRSDPAMLRDPNVQSALLDFLDLENQESDAELRKGELEQAAGKNDNSESSDNNAMYKDDVICTIESFADLHDPRQLCLLMRAGAVVPESRDTAENATRAQLAMPCLQQLSKSDLFMDRLKAVKIIVHLLASAGDSLDAGTAEAMRKAVVLALHDKELAVRIEAVDWLGRLGKPDMIPALRQIAESRPVTGATADEAFIRKNAAKAIAAIQGRSALQ
jgi:hypothetical protein